MEAVKEKWAGIAPLFGRNLLSVLTTDLINCFIAPSGPNILALLVDSFIFVIFPIVGGIVNMSVLFNYEQDPVTFGNSGLEKQKLYVQLMQTIKDTVFTVIGRPKFFDDGFTNSEETKKKKYETPQDDDLDEIYVPPSLDLLENIEDVVVLPF